MMSIGRYGFHVGGFYHQFGEGGRGLLWGQRRPRLDLSDEIAG